jgi:transcriptional regulator with XRE-family HTH domain
LEHGVKDEARRRALGEFLKSRRKRLSPTIAGLQRSGRRRLTSGLRREEVAELAGVGTTWYTWLEQARDIRPSEVTLRSIARALHLTKVERDYLLDLALERAPRTGHDVLASPLLLSIVNGIPSPAIVLGPSWDVVAYNAVANALIDLDHAPSRNFLKLLFTPQARAFHPNWAPVVRQKVALFRAQCAGRMGHPAVLELVSDLSRRSSHFREWWAEQEVSQEMHSGHVTFDHPFVGRLCFDFELLGVLESPSLVVHVLVPSNLETRVKLDELVREQRSGEHTAAHSVWTAPLDDGWARRGRGHCE